MSVNWAMNWLKGTACQPHSTTPVIPHTSKPHSAIPTDIDECVLGTDNCDDNATCTNTMGSFECECLPGYTGDGVTCEGQ